MTQEAGTGTAKAGMMELLSPAGDLEKLKMAVLYGADAVYFGGEEYSLRAQAGNFTISDMKKGIEFAHRHSCKAYIAINIYAHDSDLNGMQDYVKSIEEMGADAVILSDPGIFDIVSEYTPSLDIHISTQANSTNSKTICFWQKLGAKRVVLARELSLEEIRYIKDNIPENIELEAFVHGAMCVSYSGRCLLSSFLTGRDSNRGNCSHPCRWKYSLVEETRPGEYMPVYENQKGTFILNSKDLCMINHIPELAAAGITSLKIEGRMKSAYYTAVLTKAYRDAIDLYYDSNTIQPSVQPSVDLLSVFEEVETVSHREYHTGFYFGNSTDLQVYGTSSYIRKYEFIGLVKGYDELNKLIEIEQRNNFRTGDEVEILQPVRGMKATGIIIEKMYNSDMETIEYAPHPMMKVFIPCTMNVLPYSILRKKHKII